MPSLPTWACLAELRWRAAPSALWVGGLRLRPCPKPGITATQPAPTSATKAPCPAALCAGNDTLASGATAYVGLGHVQRFPDYWELIFGQQRPAAGNVFATLKLRKNHPAGRGCQLEGAELAVLDLGLRRHGARLHPVRLRAAAPARRATLMPAPPVSSWAAATNWHRPGRPRPRWPTAGAATAAMARPCHKCPRWKRAWAWITPKARGRRGPCGDWWPRSTALHQRPGQCGGPRLGASSGFGVLSLHASYRVQRQLKVDRRAWTTCWTKPMPST